MLLETVFARMTLSFDEVAKKAVAAAHGGVVNGRELFSGDSRSNRRRF